MIPFVLAAVLQAAPSHASLHPADVDLFLEVPERAGLLAAYEQAPVVRLLRTPEIGRWLAAVPEAQGFDPSSATDAILEQALERFGLGGALEGVRTLSFSATLPPAAAADSKRAFGGFLFVLDTDTSERADALAELVRERSKGGAQGLASALENAVAIRLGEITIPVWLATRESRVFLGGGAVSPNDVGGVLENAETSLASDPTLVRASAEFGEPAGATVLWLVQRRHALRTLLTIDENLGLFNGTLLKFARDLEPLAAWAAPFDPLEGERTLRTQLIGSSFRTEVFVAAPGATATTLDPDSMRAIPAGAMLAWSARLTETGLANTLRSAFDSLAKLGKADDAKLASARARLDELVPRFGTGVVVYSFPLVGLTVPRSYAWFDVEREEGLAEELLRIFEIIGESVPGVEARTRDYVVKDKSTGKRRAFPVTTVSVPRELLSLGPWLTISPAFAVVDGRLVVSPRSSDLKRELKRLHGGEEAEPTSALVDAARARAEDASSVATLDWRPQIRTLLDVAKTLAPLLGELSFDLEGLPSAGVFAQQLEPSFLVSRSVDGGVYWRHESSFGPETWLAILASTYRTFFAPSAPAVAPEAPGATDES